MARVKVAVAVPDLAGALQDDPAALVDLLILLALGNAVGRGSLVDALDAHLPPDAAANGRLHDFLSGLAARIGVLV